MSTHIKISTITVGSGGAASIDFTSIPATYTDLKLVMSARIEASYRQVIIKFNNSSADFTFRNILGDGASTASYTQASYGYNLIGYAPLAGTDTASTFGNMEIYIPSYASANFKSISVDSVHETNAATAYATLEAGLWSQTAAITQLTLLPYGGNDFDQYSSATLYGIKSS